MKKNIQLNLLAVIISVWMMSTAIADDYSTSLSDAFSKGKVSGTLKSYYFSQTFDGAGKNDSYIWTYGGNLKYVTGSLYGLKLGTNLQASFVGYKDDKDNKTAGSLDADGAVLSEAYLQYKIDKTEFKGGRQFVSLPLLAGSGSRLIKESFETYFISNENIPDTIITAGWARKYQTRTDKSNYGDNSFVKFENNGDGDPGEFYDIGDDGMYLVYLKNSSIKGLTVQAQYADVVDNVAGFYADAKYTFNMALKPFVAAQYYYTDYDVSTSRDNDLYGFQTGINVHGLDLFAGYTSTGGSAGDARVFRGVGQGAYYHYTGTTKTAGSGSFEAGTDAYQIGAAYKYHGLSSKIRYTDFDNPNANSDLEEYTLNMEYTFGEALKGMLKGFAVSVDYSILDYENNANDATDLRTRLIYSF
ncbi:MAG: OprD family outer membrane porin [Proteobacteria bacterium]|nr:OprD family outer membrane porin [Pseudomonadota bacterium]MBU1696244.1 OprD family outer membrane porin [Pseudomonadota bacterium]